MNTERLKAIIDEIKANPHTWDQFCYHLVTNCGTAHCIAGHAQLHMRTGNITRAQLTGTGCIIDGKEHGAYYDGREWLDLSARQAAYLFEVIRTMGEIEQFCQNGGLVPDDWNP